MYAIIQTGGKQYKAELSGVLKIEKIPGAVGQTIQFDRVLMVADGENIQVGRPFVEGIKVSARIVEHGRHPKIIILKHKRRKGYRKKQGHRQDYTAVKVESIGDHSPEEEQVAPVVENVAEAES